MDGPRFHWTSSARSDVGLVRRINEDACLAMPEYGLWAVADGMGGHAFGEVASAMVVDALACLARRHRAATLDAFAEAVRLSLQVVNHALREQAVMHDVSLVGSTVVVLLALDGQCAVLWAGDSRAYRMRGSRLQQLTRDHCDGQPSGAGDGFDQLDDGIEGAGCRAGCAAGAVHFPSQDADDPTRFSTPAAGGASAAAVGTMSANEARRENGGRTTLPDVATPVPNASNAITRAVGAADALELDEIRFAIEDGDVLMLCSDGLSREVDAADIARHLAPGNSRHAAQSLVTLALHNGGRDNVSVVVVAADDLWSADRTQLNPAC
jgi:serine/threonine protein phosphatase PrpC